MNSKPKYQLNDVVHTSSDYLMLPPQLVKIVGIKAQQVSDGNFHPSNYYYEIVPVYEDSPANTLCVLETELF